MNILLRILSNLWCVVMAAWLFCESMPALILTAHYISGDVFYSIVAVVGLVDLTVVVLLFIAVNMLASEMSTL